MRRATWAAAVLLSFAACGGCDSLPSQAVTACEGITVAAEKTDILFVVDDSGSMATKQQILASNFAGFIDELSRLPVKNDYQVAVTTTSVNLWVTGTTTFDDAFISPFAVPGLSCDPAPNAGDRYPAGALVRVSRVVGNAADPDVCTRKQFTTGTPRVLPAGSPTLIADFTENVYVGACGSGKEQGLRAAQLALSEPLLSGANAGFLRSGARLVLFIVSDADDCSDPDDAGQANEPPGCTTYDVQNFVDFFKGKIAGEQRDVLVAGIISVDPVTLAAAACAVQSAYPACAPTAATAEHAAPRYKAFVDAFGTSGVVDSICNCSFQSTLSRVATLIGQEVPLSAAPADWRLLTVSVVKPGGSRVSCTVSEAGSDGGAADAVYSPPTTTRPPTLTFGGACALQAGDQVDVKLICAG